MNIPSAIAEGIDQERLERFMAIIFFLLSLMLMVISMEAGYHFYNGLFGPKIAIIAVLTFEVLRLGALYAIFRHAGRLRMVSVALYVLVVTICATAGAVSFTSMVMKRQESLNAPYQLLVARERGQEGLRGSDQGADARYKAEDQHMQNKAGPAAER